MFIEIKIEKTYDADGLRHTIRLNKNNYIMLGIYGPDIVSDQQRITKIQFDENEKYEN